MAADDFRDALTEEPTGGMDHYSIHDLLALAEITHDLCEDTGQHSFVIITEVPDLLDRVIPRRYSRGDVFSLDGSSSRIPYFGADTVFTHKIGTRSRQGLMDYMGEKSAAPVIEIIDMLMVKSGANENGAPPLDDEPVNERELVLEDSAQNAEPEELVAQA